MKDYFHFANVVQSQYPIYLSFHPRKNWNHNLDVLIRPIPRAVIANRVHSEMSN